METIARTASLIQLEPGLPGTDLLRAVGALSQERILFTTPSGRWIAATEPLLDWLGATPSSVAGARDLGVHAWIDRADWPAFDAAVRDAAGEPREIRFRPRVGRPLRAEVRAHPVPGLPAELRAVRVEPADPRLGLAADLRRRIDEQKRRTIEAVRSGVRIYHLTERIRSAPRLTTALLDAGDEDALYRTACSVLTSEGMGFQHVTFLLVEDGALCVRFTTRPDMRGRRFRLDRESPYARILRGERDGSGSLPDRLFPLKTKETIVGVLEVLPRDKEGRLDEDLTLLRNWQRDVLETVADIIAILIENLRLYEKVKRQSIRDQLTDTYNRHYFVSRLDAEVGRAARTGRPLSVIFVDVDGFKALNDTRGHAQGDDVLRRLGALLLERTRDSDCVCRYGGDEFVILMPETGEEDALAKAEALRRAVEATPFPGVVDPAEPVWVTISCGVATPTGEGDTLAAADDALYRAKRAGRNRVARS